MKNRILSVVLAVLCILSMIPFAAFAAESYIQCFDSHTYTGTKSLENPYRAGGNYKIYGYTFADDEFDGESVVAISRNPEVDEVYAEADDGATSTSWQTNFYSYNEFKVGGKPVSLYDSQYIVIDYYYDTSAREENPDETFTEIVGNTMAFSTNSVYINGEKITSYNVAELQSVDTIVDNEWATIVIDYGTAADAKGLTDYLSLENESAGQMGQFKIFPFGLGGGINMHAADVFYIKSVRFMSYDPTSVTSDISIEVFTDAEGSDWVYDSLSEGDEYTIGDTYTLPEFPEEFVPDTYTFKYYTEPHTGQTYAAGDVITLNWGTDASTPVESYLFYPQFDKPNAVNFVVDAEDPDSTIVEYWMPGTTNNLPAAPDAPEGLFFVGWSDDTNTYKAGASYTYTDTTVSFAAVFSAPITVYVSDDGAIDGITETVYTTLDEADNAIAAGPGVGTILVEGEVQVNTMTLDSFNLTVKGYNDTAKAIFCTSSYTITGNDAELLFDDIIIRRADGSNDENFLRLVDVHLTFGEDCGYEQGTRSTNNSKMDLYISQYAASTAGYSFTNNSDAVRIAILTADGQWGGGNLTLTGDVDFEINAGTVSNAFLGTRNGNGTQTPNTRTGDVTFTMNGGTVGKFQVSHYPVKINGDATAIFNGGTITGNIYFGDEKDVATQSNISGTLTYVINAAEMTAAPTVKAGFAATAGTSILVYNNTELAETPVEADVAADYLVLVNSGVATPVAGQNGKFTIVPDDSTFDQVLANGVILEADNNGYYTLSEGTNYVSFGKEGFETYTLSYSDGGSETLIGAYFNETELVLPALTPAAGFAHDGYTINGVPYAPGDKFVMPAENVVAEVVWFANTENTWYVSATGNDNNGGHKTAKPVATIAKAFELIGANDGTIVLIDMVTGFSSAPLADGQTVRITGEGYEGAGFANSNTRLAFSKGHLILDHLIDYNNTGAETNTPFILSGNANLTIGEGYKLAIYKNGVMTVTNTGTQIEMPSAANPVVNANGDLQYITFIDYGDGTITGDVTINIGPSAQFDSSQENTAVAFGGDSNSAKTATVNGKIFVNVDGTQDDAKIYRNGFKTTTSTVLNGFQILLKNTTITYGGDHPKYATYVNNGAEYIVTASTIEGADVVTTEFGKVKVTLGENQIAVITDDNGTREITESAEIELAEGETLIECATNAKVSISLDGVVTENLTAGTLFTLPAPEVAEGQIFIGWTIDGVLYTAGSQYKLPAENGAVVVATPYSVSTSTHVYIDPANGNDENDGLSVDKPVKSIAKAETMLALFPETATLHVIGTLAAGDVVLPAYNGVLNIVGTDTNGVIQGTTGITFKSDVVFDDIGIEMTTNYKHFALNGYDLTLLDGAYKVEGSQPLMIHSGKQNASYEGDQSIKILGGHIDALYAGPFYITGTENKVWTGDLDVTVDENGYLGNISYGDGYTGVQGKFIHDGSVEINIGETGTVKTISSANYNVADTDDQIGTTGGYVVYNYSATVPTFSIGTDANTFMFNFTDDTNGIFADGVLTVNTASYIIETGENAVELVLNPVVGVNTIRTGKSVMNDGLTIEGAQIRIGTEDVAQGLRFIAKYTDELAAQYEGCEYGFVVIPTSVVGNNSIDAGDVYGESYAVAKVVAQRIYEDKGDHVLYTACMTDLEAGSYKTEYTAVPYILTADGYVYGEQYSTSVYAMAEAILADEEASGEEKAAATQIKADADAAQ